MKMIPNGGFFLEEYGGLTVKLSRSIIFWGAESQILGQPWFYRSLLHPYSLK